MIAAACSPATQIGDERIIDPAFEIGKGNQLNQVCQGFLLGECHGILEALDQPLGIPIIVAELIVDNGLIMGIRRAQTQFSPPVLVFQHGSYHEAGRTARYPGKAELLDLQIVALVGTVSGITQDR